MKRVKKPVFFIIAALILALTYTSVFGVYTQNGDTKNTWIKGAGDIRWGIDIRGGVEATFSPADGVEATAEQLEAAKAILISTGNDKFCSLCESRLSALKKRSFFRILLLHLKRESRKLFPLSVRFSDICYTLKSDKKLTEN